MRPHLWGLTCPLRPHMSLSVLLALIGLSSEGGQICCPLTCSVSPRRTRWNWSSAQHLNKVSSCCVNWNHSSETPVSGMYVQGQFGLHICLGRSSYRRKGQEGSKYMFADITSMSVFYINYLVWSPPFEVGLISLVLQMKKSEAQRGWVNQPK